MWTYDSNAHSATHTARGAVDPAAQADRKAPAGAPATPQDAAKEFLANITPTTDVRVDPEVTVAGQAAYDLVLTPKAGTSLVKQVRIAVDGAHFVPLRVRVFGTGGNPALDIAYSDISFTQPDAAMFTFNPPPHTTVTQQAAPQHKAPTATQKKALESRKAQAQKDTTTVGTGWSSVVVTKLPNSATGSNQTLQRFVKNLPETADHTGRVLKGTIFTAIVTNDGRLAVGSVDEAAVSQALAH